MVFEPCVSGRLGNLINNGETSLFHFPLIVQWKLPKWDTRMRHGCQKYAGFFHKICNFMLLNIVKNTQIRVFENY